MNKEYLQYFLVEGWNYLAPFRSAKYTDSLLEGFLRTVKIDAASECWQAIYAKKNLEAYSQKGINKSIIRSEKQIQTETIVINVLAHEIYGEKNTSFLSYMKLLQDHEKYWMAVMN